MRGIRPDMAVSACTRGATLACALLFAAHPAAVLAGGTSAGTQISNTATVSYTDGEGNAQTVASNTATLQVDEVLNVTVANSDGGNISAHSPDADVPATFNVTNTGNGTEKFRLTVDNARGGDDFNPEFVKLVIDDGDGVYEAGIDIEYVAGSNDPELAPDESATIFVINNIPAGQANGHTGDTVLIAAAVTGDGPAGTVFAGQGDGGVDAVTGVTTARAEDAGVYVIGQVSATLQKAQAVQDPQGGNSAVPGATITYTLTFTLSGSGAVTNAVISDPIPANTSYVPGSLALNGAALSDAADGDAGRFTGSQIEVALPSPLSAPTTQTVVFKVRID